MKVKSYKDLLVWQRSIDVAKDIYKLVNKLPKEEIHALSDQMRRAVVSIASNISEGQERHSPAEFSHFLHISQRSRAELETQLIIGAEIGYFNYEEVNPILEKLAEIGKMINSLVNSLPQERQKRDSQLTTNN